MAITTLDGMLASLLPPIPFAKALSGAFKGAGIWHSSFYLAGTPGAAVAPTPGLGGAALTSYAGQVPFPAAVGGKNIHLARLDVNHSASIGAFMVMDRLWHNSGFVVTSTAAQTINSVALPARDRDGATDGVGVNLAMEVTTVLGAGTPTFTVSYTNSAGVSGRIGTIGPISTTSPVGTFYTMDLQAGDIGVRSVQTITSSATMTSGAVSFVLYRRVTMCPTGAANNVVTMNAVDLGLPRFYDSSVPFVVYVPTATSTTSVDAGFTWAQG